jgi:hypothetical protein
MMMDEEDLKVIKELLASDLDREPTEQEMEEHLQYLTEKYYGYYD